MSQSIYGVYEFALEKVKDQIVTALEGFQEETQEKTGDNAFEHLLARIKSDESMREKCRHKGIAETAENALKTVRDSIGIRVICSFVDDIYNVRDFLQNLDGVDIIEEKDYIKHTKPNGYRSYHMILEITTDFPDVTGAFPGKYFVEVQVRTIAMDTWASLEHKMKYKKDIPNQELLVSELKRIADELASCDLSMQTIREQIENS